jgi:hypothetical protein
MKVRAFYSLVFLSLVSAAGVFTLVNGQTPDVKAIGGGTGITVFKERNFRGPAATYTYDVPNLAQTGFNNQISSFKVGPGEEWLMCDQPNYGGQCVNVSGQERDLRMNGWNDRASSLRRVSGGGGVPPGPNPGMNLVLFDQPYYRGQSMNYSQATPDLYNANNRAQSATVGAGEWQLCDGANFTGRCVTIRRSTPNLSVYGMRNRVSSVRPVGGYNPGPNSAAERRTDNVVRTEELPRASNRLHAGQAEHL